jgi:hypothetical protein
MNWTDYDWQKVDLLYSPKRRVDNKISWQRPHIIGSFRSVKLKKDVEFHSLGERLFYYFLELDPDVIRYYVQPVEVSIPYLDRDGQRMEWLHVPDVLVYRNGYIPQLYQIKESPTEQQTKTFNHCNKSCTNHAERNGWSYSVIYPKIMPEEIKSNLNFLFGFLKRRKSFTTLQSQVLLKVESYQEISILDLARSFVGITDFRVVLPLIYHLIAVGKLKINLAERIHEYRIVRIGSVLDQLNDYIVQNPGDEYEAS